MFVVRPKPHLTESLMGYVLRLTEANGYPTTSYVLYSMTGVWYQSAVGRLDAAPLMNLAGLSQQEADRLSLKASTSSRSIFNVAGAELTAHEFSVGRPRICPGCLEQDGFCDAFWDISHAQVCGVHGTWMVDACPGCHKHLTWSRSKVAECRCGHSLIDIRTKPAPKPLVDLMQVLRSATFRDEEIAPFPMGMDHLKGLDLAQLCKIIWVMSDTMHKKEHGDRTVRVIRSREKLSEYLPVVADALADWPEGFRRFLDKTYSAELESADVLPAFRSQFNWALVRLSKNTPGGADAFKFLIQEVYAYATRFWPKSQLIVLESQHGWVDLPDRMRWGGIADLADVLGVDTRTLKRDIDSMSAPSRITSNTRNGLQRIYDLDWARQQLPKSRSRPIGVRQAARMLGISNGALHVLRSRGVIGSTHRTYRNGVFSKEDIAQFRQKIGLAVASSPKEANGLPTLDRLSRLLDLTPEHKATLYQAILDGRISVRGSASGSPEQFQVDPAEVEVMFGGFMAERNKFISFVEVRERLQCVDAVTRALVDSSYLKMGVFKRRRRILLGSVEDFEKEYELASSIARRYDTWGRSITTLAKSKHIPYREIPCDQHVAILFERKNVGKIEAAMRGTQDPT